MITTYTAYRLHLDGSLSDRANLNDFFELEEWVADKLGRFATIRIIRDADRRFITMTDDGEKFVQIEKGDA